MQAQQSADRAAAVTETVAEVTVAGETVVAGDAAAAGDVAVAGGAAVTGDATPALQGRGLQCALVAPPRPLRQVEYVVLHARPLALPCA